MTYPCNKTEILTFYHVTKTSNLESILKRGLVEQVGERSALLNETKGVFLFKTKNAAADGVANWLGDCFKDESQLSLIEVKIKDSRNLEDDGLFEVIYRKDIKPSNLKILDRNF